jgi:CubicO group peptidase (beta-lactamase class C family)
MHLRSTLLPARAVASTAALALSCGSPTPATAPAAPAPPTAAPPAPAPMPDAMRAELDARIGRAFERVGVAAGLGVAVYTRHGTYARGFGVTDVETREPVTADTAFYIASSTKSFTALAMAILAERGELDLDATVAQFAPDAPFPAAARAGEVRLRQLLSHTSGMSNDAIGFRVAFTGQHDPPTLWQLLAATEVNQKAPLGTFEYTNVGYNMLTVLTDRRLGVRWQDLLQREIFGPAGMAHTTAIMSRAAAERWSLARPHASFDDAPRRVYLQKVDATMQSAGGMITSASDAARWLALMIEDGKLGGRAVVAPAAVRATRAPQAPVNDKRETYAHEHYGMGWYIGRYRDDALVDHFGGFVGARSHISYLPERGVGVAAFSNTTGSASNLVDAVANYVYDRMAERADADAILDAAVDEILRKHADLRARVEADRAARAGRAWTLSQPRAAYAGTYVNDRYGTIEVNTDGEALHVRFGVLRSVAEPATKPDAIRVELVPLRGEPIEFDLGGGSAPTAATYDGQRYVRRGAPR